MKVKAHALACCFCLASTAGAETLSFYGTPGLVDVPTGYALDDGHVALTTGWFGKTLRNTLTFQITPRLQGSFRYSILRDFGEIEGDRFDRSFDITYLLSEETQTWPAISVGLRDFGGTGIYSSEFIAASKRFEPGLTVTAGLGWGRLAGRNSFPNPLGEIDERFNQRPDVREGGISTTGQVDFDAWFRGEVAPFAGLSWQVNDKLTLIAEYSPDVYPLEERLIEIASPINAGLTYQFDNGVNLGAYSLYGTEFGVLLSYVLDPAAPAIPGGAATAPVPLLPGARVAAQSWNIGQGDVADAVKVAVSREGQVLEGFRISGDRVAVQIDNQRYQMAAQALGRTARQLANTLDPSIRHFDIALATKGQPVTVVSLSRDDLEELEHAFDASWASGARARIADGHGFIPATDIGPYPRFDYGVTGYLVPFFFDPDRPLRLEYGVQIDASYEPAPGFLLSGQVRQPVGGNLDDATRRSNSILPKVRSDALNYYRESETELSFATAEYFFRPAEDWFGRVTAGYLERMYGGLSAELLWYPVDSRLALGAEINYARQRDFDLGFGFRDYDVVTGHASAYYDLGNGFFTQLDVGRYLAGDWGATLSLDREFNNGVTIGAFFTLTDVPFEDFGEGSFDKGIRISLPVTWLTGQPSQASFGQTIRPVLRDGGARLDVNNRLYSLTRPLRGAELDDSWGLFWR